MEAGPKKSQFSASSLEKSRGPNLRCAWSFPHVSVLGTWAATSNVFPRLHSGSFSLPDWPLPPLFLSTRPGLAAVFLKGPQRTHVELNMPLESAPPPVFPMSVHDYPTPKHLTPTQDIYMFFSNPFSHLHFPLITKFFASTLFLFCSSVPALIQAHRIALSL